jgi:hypothetical protein
MLDYNISNWILLNWDIFTDWIGWCPDIKIYTIPDDVM